VFRDLVFDQVVAKQRHVSAEIDAAAMLRLALQKFLNIFFPTDPTGIDDIGRNTFLIAPEPQDREIGHPTANVVDGGVGRRRNQNTKFPRMQFANDRFQHPGFSGSRRPLNQHHRIIRSNGTAPGAALRGIEFGGSSFVTV